MTAAEHQFRHEKSKREAGKCGRHGCDEDSGDSYLCLGHREAARVYMRGYRRRKREGAASDRAAGT